MSSINPKENRDVIPNWRSYKRTAQLGELYALKSSEISLPIFSIIPYIEAWKENKSLSFAGDLLSAAILNGQTLLPEVRNAAQFILNNIEANELIKSIAQSVLPPNVPIEQGYNKTTSSVIAEIECKNQYLKNLINIIKNENKKFPYNPIAYCELARCYINLGVQSKAYNAMKIALHLAPYSRYVSRCAARLFIHLGDLDLAHRVLTHNPAFKQDPWLIASEIAINCSMGRNSRFVNIGKSIISSAYYSPFSCSELSSAIGTLEMINGSRKKCISFINQSLIQPNDNSLAQAEWLAGENNDLQFNFLDYKNLKYKSEAEARQFYYKKDYTAALNESINWIDDLTYDKNSVLFGSNIAFTYLKNYDIAEKILKIGLLSHKDETILINNLAYVLSLNGKASEAEYLMNKQIMFDSSLNVNSIVCHTATKGLISFRKGNIEDGTKMYLEAINLAKEKSKDKDIFIMATLNFLREGVRANVISKKEIGNILNNINLEDREIIQLKKDVEVEIEKIQETEVKSPPISLDFLS